MPADRIMNGHGKSEAVPARGSAMARGFREIALAAESMS